MIPFLARTILKSAGFAIGATTVYAAYKSGFLKTAANEVLKATHSLKTWIDSKAQESKKKEASPMKKPAKKSASRRWTDEEVIELIGTSEEGIRVKTVREVTGLKNARIYNILRKGLEQGRLKRVMRGVYKGA